MAELNELLPEPSERVFICGKTGSGKTFLAEQICQNFNYVIAYDAKGRLGLDKQGRRVGWAGFKRVTTFAQVLKLSAPAKIGSKEPKEPRIIYAPVGKELRSDATINAFFEFIYKRGNCVAYIDELTGVTNRTHLPSYFHDCLVRGRELGVMIVASSQRPMDIPPNIIESAERYYIFKVKMPQDVKRIYEATGLNYDFMQLPKRWFFYVTEEGEQRGPLTLNLEGEQKSNVSKHDNGPARASLST